METQFTETKGEMPGSFAVLSAQLFVCGEPYGSRRDARTIVGEFRVLDFDLIECEGVPFGDRFVFVGGAANLRELCADARTPLQVLCDPRFVIRPDESWDTMQAIAARRRHGCRDFRDLSFHGEPVRRDETLEVEYELRRRAFALGLAAGRGVKLRDLDPTAVSRAWRVRKVYRKNEGAIVAANSHRWFGYREACDAVIAPGARQLRAGTLAAPDTAKGRIPRPNGSAR